MPGDKLLHLDRIEIWSLAVLLRTNCKHLLVADLTHDHRQQTMFTSLGTDTAPGHTTTMAIEQLKSAAPPLHGIAMCSDNQHSLKAGFAHSLGQFLQALLIKGLPRLIGAVFDQ